MTTNEIMQDLLKLIGPVEWKEGGYKCCLVFCEIPTAREAQNHICMAAIEWLRKRGAITIVGPNASEPGRWAVTIDRGPCRGPIWYRAPTLLEALYKAVKAVKESKDASGQ